jgi:hypothetical protein
MFDWVSVRWCCHVGDQLLFGLFTMHPLTIGPDAPQAH